MKTETRHGQWLADVALAKLGALEGVWALAVRNGLSVTTELATGQELEWQPEDVADGTVAAIYRAERIEPATAASAKDMRGLLALPEPEPDDELERDPAGEANTSARVFNTIFDKEFA